MIINLIYCLFFFYRSHHFTVKVNKKSELCNLKSNLDTHNYLQTIVQSADEVLNQTHKTQKRIKVYEP